MCKIKKIHSQFHVTVQPFMYVTFMCMWGTCIFGYGQQQFYVQVIPDE